MARWERALAILRRRVPPRERVLDLGCAFGYGTRQLARRYDTYGLDASPAYVARARRLVPSAHLVVGSAEHLPYPDHYFAAIVFLDVLEHVDDERAAIRELARCLRPGGLLVLSVPHTGLLRWADSLNVYAWLTGERPLGAPGERAVPGDYHRHYSRDVVARLLGAEFHTDYVHYSGLGVAEWVNLLLLLLCKRALRNRRLYDALQYLYFGIYIAEDVIPVPHLGYHLMIAARRTGAGDQAQRHTRGRSPRLHGATRA